MLVTLLSDLFSMVFLLLYLNIINEIIVYFKLNNKIFIK
jgi:hypothetical protein